MLATAPITPDQIAKFEGMSAVSEDVVLARDLSVLVENTLIAACGESENTAKAYRTGIGYFLQYLSEKFRNEFEAEGIYPLAEPFKDGRKTVWAYRGKAVVLRAVDASCMDGFMAWRAAEGDSRATQNLRRGAVSTFLSIAFRDGVLTFEQATNLGVKPYRKKERKDIKPVGRRLTVGEVRKLRAVIDLKAKTTAKNLRDKALIDVMLFAGARRAEVASLTTANFKQDGGRWWIVLQGKGNKTRRLKVSDTLYKSITAWVEYLNTQDNGITLSLETGDLPLFYNLNKGGNLTGKPINSNVLAQIVGGYGAAAGLAPAEGDDRLGCHDLRRTAARNAFDNGASLLKVQRMLGHADPKTTAGYIGADEDDDDTAVDYVRY